MSASGETLCITCGRTAGDPPQLNHLPSGDLCPTCHARFLEAQPALVPGFGHAVVDELEVGEEEPEAEAARARFEVLGDDDDRPATSVEG